MPFAIQEKNITLNFCITENSMTPREAGNGKKQQSCGNCRTQATKLDLKKYCSSIFGKSVDLKQSSLIYHQGNITDTSLESTSDMIVQCLRISIKNNRTNSTQFLFEI